MRQIVVVVDVVSSTLAKRDFGESYANRMIADSLRLAEVELCGADPKLHHSGTASAGDSMLLIGGEKPVEIYRAAKIRQGVFKAWHKNKLAVKMAIGYGNFEEMTDDHGVISLRGADLDFLYRICEECPPAAIVVTPAFYVQLQEIGLGHMLDKRQEELRGFGQAVFYEGDGDYIIPSELLQRFRRCSDTTFVCPVLGRATDVPVPVPQVKSAKDSPAYRNLLEAGILGAALAGAVALWIQYLT